jgi:hypothetical protein
MPIDGIKSAIDGITTGLVALGLGTLILTLAAGGLCMYFAWFDTHLGGLIKRIMLCAIAGSAMLGGSGLLGRWLGGLFGLA